MKILCAALLTFLPLTLSATPLTFSGNFDGANLNTTSSQKTISGSWSFLFDDSAVTGVGFELFSGNTASITLDPNPLGATLFDTTNVVFQLNYFDGILTDLFIGGGPSANGMTSNTDDFQASYNGSTEQITATGWTLASEVSNITFATESSGSFSSQAASVPVPGTLALLGLGVLGLAARRQPRR